MTVVAGLHVTVASAARAAGIVVLLVGAGACTTTFSDSETPRPTQAAEPRNTCEQEFFTVLVSEYPPLPTEVHEAEADEVAAVFAACTGDELIAANDRYPIVFGRGPMTYLTHMVLFAGPDADRRAQLAHMCGRPALADLRACIGTES